MHISCTETNNVSKQTKARFHMTHVIKEFHRVHPNWFLSIWYVPCKPCTYLASRLALSQNRSNRASTWASSPKYQQVLPKWFLRLWCIRCKPCTYLAPKLTLFLNIPKRDYIRHTSSRSSIGYVPCKLCTYLASRLALSRNRPNGASSWASSSRSTNKRVKNGFLDYGALGTNYAPMLHWN